MAEPLPPDQTIVLVGAPGAGKSTVGVVLARRTGCEFTDVDAAIEQVAGKPISAIFLEDGEPAFRELERRVTLGALQRPGVVSLGGGAVMNPEIRDALGRHTVVWLDVSAAQATRRVGLGDSRPLLAGQGIHSTMVRLLNERLPVYEQVATHRVDTNGRRPNQVARDLMELLGFPAATGSEQPDTLREPVEGPPQTFPEPGEQSR